MKGTEENSPEIHFWLRSSSSQFHPGSTKKLCSTTAEIARVGDHYVVRGHSRSLILVPIVWKHSGGADRQRQV